MGQGRGLSSRGFPLRAGKRFRVVLLCRWLPEVTKFPASGLPYKDAACLTGQALSARALF
ncbi:hypothetical protein DESPIG_00515 [Desulfovibrio piger ATCC 29098]|uniref:Uncharacterized protein n=1 Tax=Desulfovibrio piger ATCC 29098 TaxID=411464 RepID=B6WR35_9BACT|nr:hypothetical protein DESPIG_00515 [Desulfovibrio piger ATCC 29098]